MACYGLSDHHEALVLDSKRGELVKAPAAAARSRGVVSEAKALAALKNHSEAERRRRERINSHLSTLRGLVPSNDKMDKATLLLEVIKQVKELKKKAAEASKGLVIPTDSDAVLVEPNNTTEYSSSSSSSSSLSSSSFKASLCCAYRPELLSDITRALEALPVRTVHTQVSTLADRLRLSFVFATVSSDDNNNNEAADSVREALSSVLDKASALAEYSPRTTSLPTKRRRFSNYMDSSTLYGF